MIGQVITDVTRANRGSDGSDHLASPAVSALRRYGERVALAELAYLRFHRRTGFPARMNGTRGAFEVDRWIGPASIYTERLPDALTLAG